MIPKNEIINKDIDKLLSKEFYNLMVRESIGGNAGEMHVGVNAHYNNLGEIVRFSNYPDKMKAGEKNMIFRVDVSYFFNKKSFLNIFSKQPDKYIIDGVYFDREDNEDIKSVIQDAVGYVNKLSKKERESRK